MTSINKFNSTINGTRGLAVLSVLLFHLEISLFKGGFIGVDVFFVISGYLISSSIIPQIENKKFSFTEYFERRFKRILPSYFLVIFISFILISIIFIDTHYKYSLKETFYSLLFVQNFYYWNQAGYFGLENLYKPLLNTWSLAIELQFYFFFPFLFILLRKKIIFLIILSLILSIIYSDRNFSYFIIPTRFFEFGIGILCFLIQRVRKEQNITFFSNSLFIFGIFFIIFSIFYLDGEKTFPGFHALLPCFGAGIVIYYSRLTKLNYFLDNKFLNFFGDISYSLYLIHWPLIIFYKYLFIKINLNIFDQILIVSFSIFFSFIVTTYFEVNFYKKNTPNPFITFRKLLFFYFSLFLVVTILFFNLSDDIKKINESEHKNNKNNQVAIDRSYENNSLKKILIIGNSHGLDLFKSLDNNVFFTKNYQIRYKNLGDQCYKSYVKKNNYIAKLEIFVSSVLNFGDAQLCNYFIPRLKTSDLLKNSDTIIITNRFRKSSSNYILPFVKKLKTKKNKIILMSNNPRFIDPPTLLELNKKLSIKDINKKFYLYQDKSILDLNKILKNISNSANIIFFDKYSLICNDLLFSCKALSKDRNLLFVDKDHFSKEGHKYFGKKFYENGLYNLF